MSEANVATAGDGGGGDAVEMVKWTTPDGVELDVPAAHLKGLEGIGARFSNLTKSEQAIAAREKGLARAIEAAREEAADKAFEDLDEEGLRLLAESKGLSELLAAAKADESDERQSEFDARAEIGKLRAEQAERDRTAQENAEAAEAEQAESIYAERMAEIADGLDEFKSLGNKHLQEQVYGHAWASLEEQGFPGGTEEATLASIEEAIKAGVEYAVSLQTAIIEAHAASKASGPGAPGRAAGEIQRPQEFKDMAERDAWIMKRADQLAAEADQRLATG
uniref:Uncharacterized protein n=1 Tax=viral metagenome TaxID=1070528 RepID=A0A6M3K2A4_9ZZZZ